MGRILKHRQRTCCQLHITKWIQMGLNSIIRGCLQHGCHMLSLVSHLSNGSHFDRIPQGGPGALFVQRRLGLVQAWQAGPCPMAFPHGGFGWSPQRFHHGLAGFLEVPNDSNVQASIESYRIYCLEALRSTTKHYEALLHFKLNLGISKWVHLH